MAVIYQVTDILDSSEPEDNVRTIEQAAENLKQSLIAKYYELKPEQAPGTQQDRIVLTAGVVIDE